MFLVFFDRINLSRNKDSCFGLTKVVAQSRARFNFEQKSETLLLIFHQTLSLSRNKFVVMPPSWMPTYQINQSACCISSTRNNVARQVQGFCIPYFAALMQGSRLSTLFICLSSVLCPLIGHKKRYFLLIPKEIQHSTARRLHQY